jgi:hypothetical protein
MTALTLYALLVVAYGLSLRALRRQSRCTARGHIAARQPPEPASGNKPDQRSREPQAHPEAA